MYEYELAKVCYKLLADDLKVQRDEAVAITCDSLSDMTVVDAIANVAVTLEAKPLVLKMTAEGEMPSVALAAAVKGCDVWVEVNGTAIHGTATYDTIMADPDDAPRYCSLNGATPESMVKG